MISGGESGDRPGRLGLEKIVEYQKTEVVEAMYMSGVLARIKNVLAKRRVNRPHRSCYTETLIAI